MRLAGNTLFGQLAEIHELMPMIEDSIATLSLQSSLVMPSLLLSVVFDLDVIQDIIDTVDVSLGNPST